ncbi:hypothetical protein KAU25_00680 [Candidatus Bathyarchaeota archaeon]|nr:hypothetical protein [Candidatus Bathyarchaeota archaeon]
MDLSWLLSSPKDFCCVRDLIVSSIREISTKDKIAQLASIELKGTLILPSVACKLGLPCVAVRKERKKYGLTGRVCGGTVDKGERILFFDDVISEGTSKLEGIKPLEEMGALIRHVVVVVDREHGGRETLERLGYKVHSLATISELTTHLQKSKSIPEEQAETVLKYVESVKRKR